MQYQKTFIFKMLLLTFGLLFLASCFNGQNLITGFSVASFQLENSLRQTVGIVSRTREDGFSCTGVIINERYVLTAEHCIDNDMSFFGMVIPGTDPLGDRHQLITYEMYKETEFSQAIEYEVVAYDDSLDLALLRRHGDIVGPYSIGRVSRTDVYLGEFLYGIGHPVGVTYNISDGYMSSEDHSPRSSGGEAGAEADRIINSVHVFYGNSGGPLFNSRGDIVGIMSLLIGSPHINGAVYVTSIRDFLQTHLPANYLR